jgi:hypothetical protein
MAEEPRPARGEAVDVNIPSEHPAVVGTFDERASAEAAVEALLAAGFVDDQISLVAKGGEGTPAGTFEPGALMVTVRAARREADAERILREHEAREVKVGQVEATGAVVDEKGEAV